MIHDCLGDVAKIGMDQMVSSCTLYLGQTRFRCCQSILVLIKAIKVAAWAKALQDRGGMTTPTQGAVDVATTRYDGQLLEVCRKRTGRWLNSEAADIETGEVHLSERPLLFFLLVVE